MTLANENALKEAMIALSKGDREYPKEWQELFDAPPIVYALGDTSLLAERKFAIVGARRTPASAMKIGREIAGALSEQFVVVTGVADGGDTAAIEGALSQSGRVICLLAGGFSALPQCNLSLLERVVKRGLLLSPHPFATQVRSFSYGYRNKLLAALSEGVFVLGAGEKSGALVTADYAKKRGVPVFALPYTPNAAYGCGCNRLIKEGAYLVENVADIASRFGIDLTRKKGQISLSEEERRVYEVIRERTECHVNELAAIGVPVFKLRGILSALEVKGAILSLGGNRYTVVSI